MNKYVIYTVLAGDYDRVNEVNQPGDNIDYICITDESDYDIPKPWTNIKIKNEIGSRKDFNRYYKINAHKIFQDYDASLYVDANLELLLSPFDLIEKSLNDYPIALYRHYQRNNIYDESDVCIKLGLDYAWRFHKQIKKYSEEGFISKELLECNVIFRRHNDDNLIKSMDLWWNEYMAGAKRDQISLLYSLWKNDTNYNNLGYGNIRGGNHFFHNGHHLSSKRKAINNKVRKAINYIYMNAKGKNIKNNITERI